MPSVPRIVIVDTVGDVAGIVRGALTLMNRQFTLIDVPSSDGALEEVVNSHVDLVVTAYQIPGSMHGIELAHQINHESLGTPVLVLAQADDSLPDADKLAEGPYQVFVRPVAEAFLRGLRVALDGEAAVAAESSETPLAADFGPVPPIDLDPIREVIIGLIRDVGAMGIILADRTGHVLIDEGATGYIDRETMALIMGPMFARVADIGPLVGGDAWAMHYYNGERLDVYGLALGVHYLLGLVFEGANRRAMAAVMLYGRQAAHQIVGMIGDAAYQVAAQAPAPVAKEPAPDRDETPAIAAPVEEARPPEAKAKPQTPMLEPVADLDVDALFGQGIDETMADTLFDPDELSDLAASIEADDDQRVGYDEAIDMGILDE